MSKSKPKSKSTHRAQANPQQRKLLELLGVCTLEEAVRLFQIASGSLSSTPRPPSRGPPHLDLSDPLRMLRARELAALFGVHEVTIWKWVRLGKLPKPIKLTAGVTVWRAIDLVAFLERQQMATADERALAGVRVES